MSPIVGVERVVDSVVLCVQALCTLKSQALWKGKQFCGHKPAAASCKAITVSGAPLAVVVPCLFVLAGDQPDLHPFPRCPTSPRLAPLVSNRVTVRMVPCCRCRAIVFSTVLRRMGFCCCKSHWWIASRVDGSWSHLVGVHARCAQKGLMLACPRGEEGDMMTSSTGTVLHC